MKFIVLVGFHIHLILGNQCLSYTKKLFLILSSETKTILRKDFAFVSLLKDKQVLR